MVSFAVRRKNFVDDLLFDKDSVADYFHNSVQQADFNAIGLLSGTFEFMA